MIGATLIDNGVTDIGVIDAKYVSDHGINTFPVAKPIMTSNANGSPNGDGTIKCYIPF